MIRVLANGEVAEISAETLGDRAQAYSRVLMDLGTGDGLFPYRCARADAALFCIGVDATPNQLVSLSRRCARSVKQGGAPNLMFVLSAVAELPDALAGVADRVTVNFPWASLLRELVAAEPATLRVVRRLLKPGGHLETLLNMQVLGKDDVRQRLALPEVTPEYVAQTLVPAYAACGLVVEHAAPVGASELPVRTTWGQHLTLNSRRETVFLRAIAT